MRRPGHYVALLLALVTAFAVTPNEAEEPGIGYASFVCWDYAQLPQLLAWKESSRLIGMTLAEAYPGLRPLAHEENGSPAQLTGFLRQLPDAPDRIDLVYLAAHQSSAGQWVFPDRSVADWGTLTSDLPRLKKPHRIVLLDCCYATAASRYADWTQKVAPACVYASPADQLTPDLFVFWRRPVDWAVLFPGATLWLHRHHVTDSDERISFLGLVWLEAWAKETSPPRTMADWRDFGQAMMQISQQAATQIHARNVSAISVSFPP